MSASSRPPPKARDESAVMVGIGSWEIEAKVFRREERKSDVLRGHR